MGERKSSTYVWLALGGLVLLSQYVEYSPAVPAQRDVYSKLDDCKEDWGTADKCAPVDDGRYPGGHYYGPSYGGTGTSGIPPKASPHAIGTTHVSRGGFGSLGSLHFSGS